MLNIWFGDFKEDCIIDPKNHFNLYKEKDWFNRPDVKRVIKEIDNTIAIKDEYLESPVFGGMSPERLSTGCKCLILLIINPKCNVYASRMGDNCAKFILELAEKEDVVITLHHMMNFRQDFTAKILDTGRIIHTMDEYIDEYLKIRKC